MAFVTKVFGEARGAAIARQLRGLPVIGGAFGVRPARVAALVDAAETILRVKNGNPIFGAKPLGAKHLTVNQAKAAWFDLATHEQDAVLAWVKRREELHKLYGVVGHQQGYFHHIFEQLDAVGGDAGIMLRDKLATPRMKRKGAEGYKKDFAKGWSAYEEALSSEKAWNDHVHDIVNVAGRDWPAKAVLPKDWVRIPAKIGEVEVLGAGKIIPKAFYDKWVEVAGAGAEMGKAMKLMKNVGNFVKTVVLSSVKTLLRNVIGGSAQYGIYSMGQFFKGLVGMARGETGAVRGMMAPARGLLESLLPASWDAVPTWALGTGVTGDVQVTGALKKITDATLVAYSSIENYFKRALTISEFRARGLSPYGELSGGKMLRAGDLMAESRQLNKSIRRVTDAFAFDYQAIHPSLRKFRDSPLSWPLMMFPVYPTKFARMTTRLLGAFNPLERMSAVERSARMMTFGTMMGAGYYLWRRPGGIAGLPAAKGFDRQGDNDGVRVSSDEKSESFLSTEDLPVFGMMEWILKGRMGEAVDRSVGGVGAPGPAIQFAMILGASDPAEVSGKLGTMAGTLLTPFGRMTRDVKKYQRARDVESMRKANKEKPDSFSSEEINARVERKPNSFLEGAGEFLPFSGTRKKGDRLPMLDADKQLLEGATGIKVTKVDRRARAASWMSAVRGEMKTARDADDKDRVEELEEKMETGKAWFNRERHAIDLVKVDGKKVDFDKISERERAVIERLPERAQARVRAVLDGDTFELMDGTKVRLKGVDAPEVAHEGKGKAKFWSAEATAALEAMVKDKPIYLVGREDEKDEYGRRLAYVYVGDGVLVQRELVRHGHGKALLHYEFLFEKEFADLERAAAKRGEGLWQEESE